MGITCNLCPCWNYTCKFKCSVGKSTRIGGWSANIVKFWMSSSRFLVKFPVNEFFCFSSIFSFLLVIWESHFIWLLASNFTKFHMHWILTEWTIEVKLEVEHVYIYFLSEVLWLEFFTQDQFSKLLLPRICSISLHFLCRTCYVSLKWWHLKYFTEYFFSPVYSQVRVFYIKHSMPSIMQAV